MLSSNLDVLLKLAKTTSPQKLFPSGCNTLYITPPPLLEWARWSGLAGYIYFTRSPPASKWTNQTKPSALISEMGQTKPNLQH